MFKVNYKDFSLSIIKQDKERLSHEKIPSYELQVKLARWLEHLSQNIKFQTINNKNHLQIKNR